jgi:hypothetical protein
VEAALKDDPGYLVWLRQDRKDKQGDLRFFSLEVSRLLDAEISKSKQLQKKYQPWNLQAPSVVTPLSLVPPAKEVVESHYSRDWGAF